MHRGSLAGVLLVTFFAIALPWSAGAETRIALVIGNSAYSSGPLSSPKDDAEAVEGKLKDLGFQVIRKTDLRREEFFNAIRDFGDRLQQPGTVGLFYYSGHGMQVNNRNYMIPTDSDIRSELDVGRFAVPVDDVLLRMELGKSNPNFVVLDACRNNPFEKRFKSSPDGLAPMEAPPSTLIAFAAAPGRVAEAGLGGKLSPYTQALVEHIDKPYPTFISMFQAVQNTVYARSGQKQSPRLELPPGLPDFSFKPVIASSPPPISLSTTAPDTTTPKVEPEQRRKVKIERAASGATLDTVKSRGELKCGVHSGIYGFSAPDGKGLWKGIDVDICRAVSAAVFGDASKVKYVPLSAQERLNALQSGEIDLLSRNTVWTLTRDTANGLNFAGVNYYDGQGFMVPKKLGVTRAGWLSGARVCVQAGTTTELNLADYFRANKMELHPVTIEKYEEVIGAFLAGRCDAITSDVSLLAAMRANDAANPADYVILPEIISKEPLGPAVRHGDDRWFKIVRWSLLAMINAEELGLTQATVDFNLTSQNFNIRLLLGVTGDLGRGMGLDNKWAYNIVKQVGNYAEIFERNVGRGSKLQLPRGLNALWTDGGLMYAPPFR